MAEGYKDWSAGEILTAADLEDYTVKQSVMRFADSSARSSALSGVLAEGMVSYLKDTDTVEVYDGSAWAAVGGGGKILQLVRATDSTARSTTSTSFVDADISVTITPTSATSKVLLIWSFNQNIQNTGSASTRGNYQITDSSNVAISGAEGNYVGLFNTTIRSFAHVTMIGYDSPATTSATTYKGRFKVQDLGGLTNNIMNNFNTGQLFALEISA